MDLVVEGFQSGETSTCCGNEGLNKISIDDGSSEDDIDEECDFVFDMLDEVDDEVCEEEADDLCEEEQNQIVEGFRVDSMEDMDKIDWKKLTPHEFMMYHFCDKVVAFMFYTCYGRYIGFGARKSKVIRNKDGEIIQQVFVCHREGYREEKNRKRQDRKREPKFETRCGCEAKMKVHINGETGRWFVSYFSDDHNHDLMDENFCKMLPIHRRMTDDDITQMMNMRKVGMTTPQIYGCFGNRSGGFDKVGFRKRDMYNEIGRQRQMQYSDANAALTYLKGLSLNDKALFWRYTTDHEGRLQHLFWADGMSQVDYEVFGDVLAFDATYRKNKYCCPVVIFLGVNHHYKSIVFGCGVVSNETEETYVWLLEKFAEAMKGKAPMSVITDGDVAMKNAISRVFPKAYHRLCAWHLQRNAKTHIRDVGFLQSLLDAC